MALRLDLNSLPLPAEGASTSIYPQYASAGSGKGLIDSPIDVEALDDEVQLLPSSATFPQRRSHQRRRNNRLIIDLEQAAETTAVQSGVSVIEPAAILLSLSGPTNHERTSTKRKYIIQHPSIDVEEYLQTKYRRENAMSSSYKEPERVVAPPLPPPPSPSLPPPPPPPPPPKELIFNCPVCMHSITNPCSTFCGHIFCQSCLEAYIAVAVKKKAGKLCPTCRTKLPARKSFHRVYLPNAD